MRYSHRPIPFYKKIYMAIHFLIGLVTYASVNLLKKVKAALAYLFFFNTILKQLLLKILFRS